MKRFGLFGIVALLASSLSFAEGLDLSSGTMTSGGNLSINYRGSLSSWSTDNLTGGAMFNFGYFVVDNLALTFDIGAAGKLTTGTDATRQFSLGVNLMYAFCEGSTVRPYLAVGGYGAYWTPTVAVGTIWSAGVKPAVGLLIGLNDHVALDFGIQAKLDFPLTGVNTSNSIDGGVGYFGVRGFF